MALKKNKKKESNEIKKEEIHENLPEKVSPKILSFEEFYISKQSEIAPNEPRHPDWYMLGASPNQYPYSDSNLESPVRAYEKYKKEFKNV